MCDISNCNTKPIVKEVDFESLDPTIQQLLQEAQKKRNNAYAQYSQFKVGASVMTETNEIFGGCNVENATYTSICAERTAYVKAISEGNRKFKSVAVVATHDKSFVFPCGICRQFMMEFGDVTVYMGQPTLKKIAVAKLSDLLPYTFQL